MIGAEWFQIYLNILSILAIIIVPTAFVASVVGWWFVRKYKGFKLPLFLAIINTIAFPISLYIGILAWNRLKGGEPVNWAPPVSATVFIMLDIIPFLTTGYMIWLYRRAGRGDGRSRRQDDYPSEINPGDRV